MAGVFLKNVCKMYNSDIIAVNNFNLEIKDKEFIVLVGPSGCGKSTTLRMVAGLEGISKGEIYIGNTLVNDMEPKDRDIAMVFQNYALYPHMSVFENLAFGLKLRKISKKEIEEKVNKVAQILDIEEILKRKPKELSGGQRQRVAIGRAMVREPKVFLMDEPLSNLDAKLRVQMRIEIAKLYNKLETTFIYVTHDQIEAMTLGTRIVVMNEGIIQQVDTPSKIYNNPANIFVAGFIGSPQMNFIEGKVEEENGIIYVQSEKININAIRNNQEVLKKYVGKNVVIGIRPEYIHIVDKENSNISVKVEMIENMGSEKYIHFKINDRIIVSRYSAKDDFKIGESVYIKFDEENIILFNKENGQSII
ncbi:ABC transporter ATP-binding protein [Clostridium botulinum]|uniref:ABC transporter ATP-binding protein n=1 Tax=Clostridium botulinum TaxID=1491 RepID=UPI003A809690